MKILSFPVNEPLRQADNEMRSGTPEDVLGHAECYLRLLDEHMNALRKLKRDPNAEVPTSPEAQGLTDQIRSAVRCEIEGTTSERNRIVTLIESFTNVTGWSAAGTLNQHNFRGACDWELVGTGVKSISNGASMGILEAVEEAKRLRREDYFSPPVSVAV